MPSQQVGSCASHSPIEHLWVCIVTKEDCLPTLVVPCYSFQQKLQKVLRKTWGQDQPEESLHHCARSDSPDSKPGELIRTCWNYWGYEGHLLTASPQIFEQKPSKLNQRPVKFWVQYGLKVVEVLRVTETVWNPRAMMHVLGRRVLSYPILTSKRYQVGTKAIQLSSYSQRPFQLFNWSIIITRNQAVFILHPKSAQLAAVALPANAKNEQRSMYLAVLSL